MGHSNYKEAKRQVFVGMAILAIVTVIEVFVSLFGKGHLGYDPSTSSIATLILVIVGILLIVLSLYKAKFIIYEFMHMGHEVPALRMTVLMPMGLLIWAIFAFFQEGDSWKKRRLQIKDKNELPANESKQQGYLGNSEEVYDWRG